MKKYQAFLLLLMLSQVALLSAQDHNDEEQHASDHESLSPHRISLLTGYGLISGAINEEGDAVPKIIPVIGLDYNYWFNHKIAVGLMTDLELISYTIQDEDKHYLDRSYAFVAAAVFIYEPIHNWAFFAGPGYEMETHHSFALLKIGTEFGKTFDGGWGLGVCIAMDIKEVNSALTTGLVASKRFGKSKH